MSEVHPFAKACEQFTRRITDFEFALGADVDPDSVRVTVNGIEVQPTHQPTAGTTVLKAERLTIQPFPQPPPSRVMK